MDGRRFNGGIRPGAGRKPKIEEQRLIEKLTPLEKDAFRALKEGIADDQSWAIKMFFEYMYGKAKDRKEIDFPNGVPMINMEEWS